MHSAELEALDSEYAKTEIFQRQSDCKAAKVPFIINKSNKETLSYHKSTLVEVGVVPECSIVGQIGKENSILTN